MSDLDHHRHELQVSQDEVLRLGQLLSTKDSTIRDLRASKKLVAQELEAARLSHPVLEGKPNANHVRAKIRNSCT
jgi:uncharacterized protein YaaR (DUF327 family)